MTSLPDAPDDLMQSTPGFLVVGLGASAGGVEALQAFFAHTAADTGMAYVVILHLSPDHDSQLASILQAVTPMPVTQITERVRVEPNHVYVIPPSQHLLMVDGHIAVSPTTTLEERRAPVDLFFRTLADSHATRAVCVVLSGTGANGSMGLKRVKEHGGAVFVQDPQEAAYGEMPRNAMATNLVDDVLPVAAIPARIVAYAAGLGRVAIPVDAEQRPEDQQHALREVFVQLRLRTGHDFSNYKRPTMLRRIERRISVHNLPNLPSYAAFLREHPDEAHALLKDLLISVTNFFRDKEAFEALETDILPDILRRKTHQEQVRVWVVGCATGEEAYSLAMLLAERTFGVLDAPKVQIFATDIDEAALAHARQGRYTLNDAADVSPERLRRFFTKDGDGYRVTPDLREMVLFANHNVIKDPPFSHLDLVTCRNLLIYLDRTAQERVIETFHFALGSSGYLFLGTSESVDGAGDLFAPLSREHHVFQSRPTRSRSFLVPESVPALRLEMPQVSAVPHAQEHGVRELLNVGELHLRLLQQYAPASVIVNEEYDIVHLSGQARHYLQLAEGAPSNNLLALIRPELRHELRNALYQAVQRQTKVVAPNLSVRIDDHVETLSIEVRPVLREDDRARGFVLIVFESSATTTSDAETVVRSDTPVERQLEAEVGRLRAELRTANEQYETHAEELKSTNEELQATVEELRSAAEELETSREELQSINEELRTVNQELKVKVDETTKANNNLHNLVNSTNIGTIFLDRGFRVALFTPAATDIFNLIAADQGRPLSDITHRLVDGDVLADAERVLGTLQPIEREVHAVDGRVFLMRVSPYRTSDDHIGGVVITFLDITERKAAEQELRESEERFRSVSESGAIAIAFFDTSGAITDANDAFLDLVGYTRDELEAGEVRWDRLTPPEWMPQTREAVRNYERTGRIEPYEKEYFRKSGERFWGLFGGRRIESSGEGVAFVLDITERNRAEAALRESEARLQSIANLVPDLLWDSEPDGSTNWYNQRWLEYTGQSFQQAIGWGWTDAIHLDDREASARRYHEAVAQGVPLWQEHRIRRHDGAYRWFVVNAFPLKDEQGTVTKMYGAATDIHESRLALEAVRASEERLRRAISIETVGVLFFGLDGQIHDANDAFLCMSGYSPTELRATHLEALTAPEFLEPTRRTIQNLAERGETPPYEKQMIRSDGSRWWGLCAPTRLSGSGTESECVEFIIDITQSKQVQEALRDSEARFRTLADAVTQLIWTNNAGGEAVYFNQRWYDYSGLTYEQSAGPGWQAIVHPDDAPASVERWQRALAAGEVFDTEYRLRRSDGAYRWFIGRNVSLRDDGGQIVGWFGSATDIEDLKQAETALQRAHDQLESRVEERTTELAAANRLLQQEIGERKQLAAQRAMLMERILTEQEAERQRIARELHDTLGQFLSALNMRLSMARSREALPSEVSEELAQLLRLSSQIDREVERLSMELRPPALGDLGLADALRSYTEEWSATSRVPVEVMVIGLESSRLRPAIETTVYRIMQEALTNVLKHAQASAVSLVIERQPGALRVIIEDNGMGFEASAGIASGTGGRQFGLIGMSERAALVRGELTIETAPGAGTTIYLHIPLGEEPPEGTGNADE